MDQPAAGLEDLQVLREIGASDHVQHDVDAAVGLRHGLEVLGGDVDGEVGADLAGLLGLVGAAAGADHSGAGGLGHLNRRDADPGGGAVHHQGLARLQRPVFEHIGVDGEHGLRQARGLHEAETRGDGQGVASVADGVFGVPAAAQQGADPVAHLPAPGGLRHLAGDLQAQGRGRPRWRRIVAKTLQEVRTVHPGGFDSDQDLARPWRRPLDLGRLQGLGGSVAAFDGDGGHHLAHTGLP